MLFLTSEQKIENILELNDLEMLNLESQKGHRSSRGRKYVKQPVCSFNKFQDFLVSKSKQKTPKAFFLDRPLMTGQIKIQKLNFNKTASDNQFLPPKSIDKFYKNSTNRSQFTFPKQQLQVSQTQTPIQKTIIWSFDSTNEEYLPRPQQIKAKIESNAMQRFQELFKKQTNIRAKRIEEEQSKRLMRLLQNTTRKHQPNQNSARNVRESLNVYMNYANGQKNKLNQQQIHLSENSYVKKQPEETIDYKIKLKQSIDTKKMADQTQKNKTIEMGFESQQTQKSAKIKQSQNKAFFKERTSVDLAKQLKKKTIQIDDRNKNVQMTEQYPESIKKSIQKTEDIQVDVDRKEIKKAQDEVRKSQQNGQLRLSEARENKKEETTHNQKKRIKQEEKNKHEEIEVQKKPSLQASKSNQEQSQQKQRSIPQAIQPIQKSKKNENKSIEQKTVTTQKVQKQQYCKKNSFNVQQLDSFDLLPTVGMVEKPQPSIKQIENNNANNAQNNRKNYQKKGQESKEKLQMEEKIKNKGNARQKTQQSISGQNSTKQKTLITIKGAKQVKSTKNQPNPAQGSERYHTNQDDFDQLQEVSLGGKEANKKQQPQKQQKQMSKRSLQANKSQGQNPNNFTSNQKEPTKSSTQVSNKNIKPSTQTSLANGLDKIKSDNKQPQQKPQSANNNNEHSQNTSPLKSQALTAQNKQKPQSQQRVQFNDSQQGESCPADELGYLLDLVQTLGSYYTDSKHFYSQPDSSMIEIVMNHKLAAYFLAQQYYFYINLFQKCAQAENKDEFYCLSAEQFEQALKDEQMSQGIEELKKSGQLAVKLIKMTFEKCKMYLKKHQKQLTISCQLSYHKQCVQYLKAQFSGLYNLYVDKITVPLGKRLCYLIQTYSLLMQLNQEDLKEYQDVQELQPQLYIKHIDKYKHLLAV